MAAQALCTPRSWPCVTKTWSNNYANLGMNGDFVAEISLPNLLRIDPSFLTSLRARSGQMKEIPACEKQDLMPDK